MNNRIDIYTFEPHYEHLSSSCNYLPGRNQYLLKWKEYCEQWDKRGKHILNEGEMSVIPNGIELTPSEYRYFREHGFDLDRIAGWCMSGRDAHEFMRLIAPAPGYSADASEEDWSGEIIDLGMLAPRAGFYKVVKIDDVKADCYYTRSRTLDFLDEIVTINLEPLYNKRSSRGPKDWKIKEGDIINVMRTSVKRYFFPEHLEEAKELTYAYRVEWRIIIDEIVPYTYNEVVSHAKNFDNPFISVLIKGEYFRIDLDESTEALTTMLPSGDIIPISPELDEGNEREVYAITFPFNNDRLIIPRLELDELVFRFNDEQLETLCSYIRNTEFITSIDAEIIQDICYKSPIIVPAAINDRKRFTRIFDYEPLKFFSSDEYECVFRLFYASEFEVIIEKNGHLTYYYSERNMCRKLQL